MLADPLNYVPDAALFYAALGISIGAILLSLSKKHTQQSLTIAISAVAFALLCIAKNW